MKTKDSLVGVKKNNYSYLTWLLQYFLQGNKFPPRNVSARIVEGSPFAKVHLKTRNGGRIVEELPKTAPAGWELATYLAEDKLSFAKVHYGTPNEM